MKTQERRLPLVFPMKTIEAEELIKFFTRVRTVCNNTEDADIFFDSQGTKITKDRLQPTMIVVELLGAHPTDDAIWDNTNPCNVSFDNMDGTEIAAILKSQKNQPSQQQHPCQLKMRSHGLMHMKNLIYSTRLQKPWTITRNGTIHQSFLEIQVKTTSL